MAKVCPRDRSARIYIWRETFARFVPLQKFGLIEPKTIASAAMTAGIPIRLQRIFSKLGCASQRAVQDFLFGGVGAVELAADPPVTHDENPVAEAEDLRQLRRDHHDGGAA